MNLDDLVVSLGMALATLAFVLVSMVRTLRRLAAARPGQPPGQGRIRPVAARPPVPKPPDRTPGPQRRRTEVPKRQPIPPLEARLFRNRRLSTGARLIVASEILSRPKSLRPRRPI